MTDSVSGQDPLRQLARERGRILGELGVRATDSAWTRSEADAIWSLTTPALRLRLPAPVARWLRRVIRAAR